MVAHIYLYYITVSRIGVSTEALIAATQARLHACSYTELTLIDIGNINRTSQLATYSIGDGAFTYRAIKLLAIIL